MDLENLNNIFNKDSLQECLTFISLFVGMYENFIDTVEDRIKSFLCNEVNFDDNGNPKFNKSTEYKDLIEKRRVDALGNKNSLMATMLWLLDAGAITKKDYDFFIEIKKNRDIYVHQMSDCIWNGLTNADTDLLMKMLDLFCKIDQWWINEIEIPIAGDAIPAGYDKEGVVGFNLLSYEIIIDVLYGNSNKYWDTVVKYYENNLK
jgi:hypothetical protein